MPAEEMSFRVVVVGAGFAGSTLVRNLPSGLRSPAETLLVDKNENLGFVPLAHEVAAGRLRPESVRSPIPPLCAGRCRFLRAEMKNVLLEERAVETTAGKVHYEYLALAPGSSAARPPDNLAPHFRIFWNVDDAVTLRGDLARAWNAAANPDAEEQTVAIAGGGATGVELACEIAALFDWLQRHAGFARRPRVRPRVVLLEASGRLMRWLDPYFHDRAMRALERFGVEVRLRAPVEAASSTAVRAGGEWLPATVKVWTAGLRVGGVLSNLPADRDAAGRIEVGPHLTLPNHPEVYLLGDAGVYKDPRRGPLPPTASVAVQQGPFVARDLERRLRGSSHRPRFDFFDRGYVVSLGPNDAAAAALGARFGGPAAHALYRTILLSYLRGRDRRALAVGDLATEPLGRLGFS